MFAFSSDCTPSRRHGAITVRNSSRPSPCDTDSTSASDDDDDDTMTQRHLLGGGGSMSASSQQQEVECAVCMDDVPRTSCPTLGSCGHRSVCWGCTVNHVRTQTRTSLLPDVKCPVAGCACIMPHATVLRMLARRQRRSFQRRIRDAALAGLRPRGFRWCPASCGNGWFIDPKPTVSCRHTCERCSSVVCLSCIEAHTGLCAFNKPRAHSVNLRPCPACGAPSYKDGGCPRVLCGSCGMSWDWTMYDSVEPTMDKDGKQVYHRAASRSWKELGRMAVLLLFATLLGGASYAFLPSWYTRLPYITLSLISLFEARARSTTLASSHYCISLCASGFGFAARLAAKAVELGTLWLAGRFAAGGYIAWVLTGAAKLPVAAETAVTGMELILNGIFLGALVLPPLLFPLRPLARRVWGGMQAAWRGLRAAWTTLRGMLAL